MKKNISYLGVYGVLVGLIISRFIVTEYGGNARVVIMVCALMISIFAMIGIIYKKKYLAALYALAMVLPLSLMTIGMYLDNLFIAFGGLGLLIILILVTIKILPEFKRRQ
ncbi:hypothetical protein [Clostridium sp.]|uniref:hypothetical protein n=1 Tax=Clostridium sp. TaxID=1506 RepID=UPI001A3E58B9|nr:hypothetical protein [Clostridium sp.]MBK5240176.1 hypothetical protein [Clostridium sp.]